MYFESILQKNLHFTNIWGKNIFLEVKLKKKLFRYSDGKNCIIQFVCNRAKKQDFFLNPQIN
jgi:hypothetical protein